MASGGRRASFLQLMAPDRLQWPSEWLHIHMPVGSIHWIQWATTNLKVHEIGRRSDLGGMREERGVDYHNSILEIYIYIYNILKE